MKKRSTFKRGLSLLMALVMILGYLPAQHVHAASNAEGGLEGQAADVFTALGFDTTVLPEGYDPNTTENPFGREKLPGNPIYEMVIGSSDGMKIAGKAQVFPAPSVLSAAPRCLWRSSAVSPATLTATVCPVKWSMWAFRLCPWTTTAATGLP